MLLLFIFQLSQRKSKMIVFLSTQGSVEFHERLLKTTLQNCHLGEDEEEKAVDVYKLHGDMLQKDRTKIFSEFSNVTSGVLLCTVRFMFEKLNGTQGTVTNLN